MKIFELFRSDVTRDIPPVVYFHEQDPAKLQAEVGEYIITGGWPKGHTRYIKDGIHEHYVRLLTRIAKARDPELPASWISGFYGSGKSSFAKLLGLSLDGKKLPDGRLLADAWLARDTSELRGELHSAWKSLRDKYDPISVVFDIGGVSRGDEHIHSAVVRQVQARLGYCDKEPMVADYEIKLEREKQYEQFKKTAQEVLGKPWDETKNTYMAEDDFSVVLHHMFPQRYPDPMDWVGARSGQQSHSLSAEDAAKAIAHMLDRRAPGKTLFIVIDEVSQYIYQDHKRMLAMQSLVSALGQRLRGKAWLLATGQQQLDDQNAGQAGVVLGKMKDRFPAAYRVHLSTVNIRDVVHKRLLHKKPEHERRLRELFTSHRANLKLYAYKCEDILQEDFIEVYPMLPEHIELIMAITSALRTRSRRAQGDDHAIRGLLQLLGELFRSQGLAKMDVGALVTLDMIYEVQSAALEPEVQRTMVSILRHCTKHGNELAARCAKAVSLLQLLQGDDERTGVNTTSKLVAQSLYANIADGDNEPAVREALESLRRANLLGLSKRGYKIQSSSGQEWENERRNIQITPEVKADAVREALERLVGETDRPKLHGRGFPWLGLFSTELSHEEKPLRTSRDEAPITIDFRFVSKEQQDAANWVVRSNESRYRRRIVWVTGQYDLVLRCAGNLCKSARMVRRYEEKIESLKPTQRSLLFEEKRNLDDLHKELLDTVSVAFMEGRIYFDGAKDEPTSLGSTFRTALLAAGNRRLPQIYDQYVPTQILPKELKQIIVTPLSGPSPKFFDGELGILSDDAGRIVATCSGPVPTALREAIERSGGQSGALLLKLFSAPPYGLTTNVVKSCLAGLLHAKKIVIVPSGGQRITEVADRGVENIFERDRMFKQADFFLAGEQRIKARDRAKIVKLFATVFQRTVEPENGPIADAVFQTLPPMSTQLSSVEARLNQLPGRPEAPPELTRLRKVAEDCLRDRQIEPTVLAVKRHLDALRDGARLLRDFDLELTADAIDEVNRAHRVVQNHLVQLYEVGAVTSDLVDSEQRIGELFKGERPWVGIDELSNDIDAIREAYRQERHSRLNQQERDAEEVREFIRNQPAFAALDEAQRNAVLRPINAAKTETTQDAIAPSLASLSEGFATKLAHAKSEALTKLDQLASREQGEIVVRVSLELHDREIRNAADVDALLNEIRTRLLQQLNKSDKVRLRLT